MFRIRTILHTAAAVCVIVPWVAATDREPVSVRKLPDQHGLQRILQVNARIYSGAEPQGRTGFAALRKMGVNTLVSVDAARPQIELARQHGMRYVHIPIGYHALDERALQMVEQLIREDQGRIFIHCHHGRQRGPAVAAIARIVDGGPSGEEALAVLKSAGTSQTYPGLWRDVKSYRVKARVSQSVDLREEVDVDPLARSMARADRDLDMIIRLGDNGWSAEETGSRATVKALDRLRTAFQDLEVAREGYDNSYSAEWFRGSRALKQLTLAIERRDKKAAAAQLVRVKSACTECHARHRNQ